MDDKLSTNWLSVTNYKQVDDLLATSPKVDDLLKRVCETGKFAI